MIESFIVPSGRRAYHTLLAASFGIAFISDFSHLQIHTLAGYAAGLLILLRVLGEAMKARRGMFEDYLAAPKEVITHWKDLAAGRVHSPTAHNPSSATMALVLMVFVTATVLSGVLAYGAKELQGPAAGLLSSHAWRIGSTLETLHGILATVTLAFICLHVSGAVYESIRGERNWVRLIFIGENMKHMTGLILFVVAAGTLNASPADDLLKRYASEGSGPPSAERGAEAWVREGMPGRTCVSCHTGNLRQPGSHKDTGETIKPLAPSVNPLRLGDAKFIEKWFTRNCKWTYGRTCTAREKADFLEFIRRQ